MTSVESQFDDLLISKPGEQVRPRVNLEVACDLVKRLYGLNVKSINQLNSYEDKNFFVEVLQEHTNPNISEISPSGYTLKVLNALESTKPEFVEGQNALMTFLHQRGFNCPVPVPNLENKLLSLEQLPLDVISEPSNNNEEISYSCFVVRLLTFVPGKLLTNVEYTPVFLFKTGEYLAQLHEAMKDFFHDSLNLRKTLWLMENVPKLQEYLYVMKDEGNKEVVQEVIEAFKTEVEPRYKELPKGQLHGDYNEQNILVDVNILETDESGSVPNGILDFADAQYSYYIFDVAMAIMYMMFDSKTLDAMQIGGYVLAGYMSIRNLSETEWELLKTLVAARFCQSLVLGTYNSLLDPNNDYITITQRRGWTVLNRFWKIPKEDIYSNWKKAIKEINKTLKTDI